MSQQVERKIWFYIRFLAIIFGVEPKITYMYVGHYQLLIGYVSKILDGEFRIFITGI